MRPSTYARLTAQGSIRESGCASGIDAEYPRVVAVRQVRFPFPARRHAGAYRRCSKVGGICCEMGHRRKRAGFSVADYGVPGR